MQSEKTGLYEAMQTSRELCMSRVFLWVMKEQPRMAYGGAGGNNT